MRSRKKKIGKSGHYEGPVMFGSDGFHYPVGADGHKAGDQPLVVELIDGEEVFVWGSDESPTHYHSYHQRDAEIFPFTED